MSLFFKYIIESDKVIHSLIHMEHRNLFSECNNQLKLNRN